MKLANSPSQFLLHLVFCILLASCGSTQSTKTVETTNHLEEYRAAEANYSGDTEAELQLILAELDSSKTAEVTNKLFQKALAFKKNKMEFSALKYLEKAAELGNANSQWYLADYYMDGIIIDVRVFSRQDRTERSKKFEKQSIERLGRKKDQLVGQVKEIRDNRLRRLFAGQTARSHGVFTSYSKRKTLEVDAPEIERRCREDGADVVLLTPI